MKQTDDEVGVFLFFYDANPLLCAFTNVVESQSFPHALRHPVRNGRGDESDDGNLHAAAVEHGVRLEVRLLGFDVNGIGTEDRKVAVVDELVEDVVPSFNVVISDNSDIVADKIADVGHLVALRRTNEIEIIGSGFTLQHVTSINEDG